MRPSLRQTLTAGTALVLALGLSACSAEQSVPDACAVIKTEMTTHLSDIGSGLTAASTDLAEGGEQLAKLSGKISATADKVENPEVKKSVDALSAAIKDVSTVVKENAKDSENATDESYGPAMVSLTDANTAYSKLCAA
ncbi:hypothetical protein [Mycetocola saprophilus]|uniref:hypothetical protein n=1 Tax=Mycetocola saprophilus TaxID=76636 RepID=UPI003BF2DA4F